MTYFTIETTPQSQPGACFITGKHEDDWFVRLPCAEAHPFGTILVSATGFRQLAKDLGFAPKDAKVNLLEGLKETLNELGPAFTLVLDELRIAQRSLLPLEEVLRRITELTEVVGAIPAILREDNFEPPAIPERASESDSERGLADLLPASNRKRTPGTDRKAEPGRELFSTGD